jgi:hypothetical protein
MRQIIIIAIGLVAFVLVASRLRPPPPEIQPTKPLPAVSVLE